MKAFNRHDKPNVRSRGAALPNPPSPGCSWYDRQTRPRLLTALGLALLGTLLFGWVSTLPVFAAYQYRMIVTNTTGAPLYLYVAPWDTLRGDEYYNPTQSSCLDMAGGLGVQRAIPIGGSTTLVFNRSGRCKGLQGWLSLRASANPQSTGTDYQQFWFDDDEGALEKHGRMSVYQNQLAGGRGFYTLNVLTATDLGHDYLRYGYKMAVKNSSTKPIWVTAAPDDEGGYGHVRSSCITPNSSSPFGQPYQLLSGEIKNFYFARSVACSGEQGYFSLRASAEPNSIGTDFAQFDFDADTGTLQKAADGVKATWPNTLARLGMGHYLLDVTGAETVGGYLFRNYGYQFPAYANWPGQNPVTRSLGAWDATRQYAEITWRTTGQNSAGQPISLPVGNYASCFGNRYWHTQSMVQLPSKDGHAYFARTDSFRRLGSFYVLKSDADAYDPVNDYVKDTPGTDGAVVYLDQYWSGSPIGDWNHPGDMSVVGNLLIIAGQQWHSDNWFICNEYDDHDKPFNFDDKFEGQDADAVLFYDVSDPERPKYLGKITEGELGFSGQNAIDAVGLSKTANGIWSLMVGGQISGNDDAQTKYFRTQKPWPNRALWQPYTNGNGQIVTINSYENQNGVERLLRTGLSRPCKVKDPVLDVCTLYFDDFARLNTATVRFLEPAQSYDLTFNTTSATTELPQAFFPELHKNCSEGGGSVAVSKSGAVNIHCPFLGEPQKPSNNACTDTSQNCIVSFHYSMPNPNVPPSALTSPTPADGATNLPITTIFSWSGGDDPDVGASVTYDVLLSIPGARNDLFRTVCSGLTTKTCDASSYLAHKTSYTWQVVANDGWQSTRGPLWTFSTISGNVPPNAPTTPDPVDTALNVPVTTYLSWRGSDPDGGDTLTYDVYLARFGEPTYTLVCNDLTTAVCELPSDLAYGSGYFWMVETFDGEATTRGPDWRFNTPPGFTLSVDVNPKTFRADGEAFEYTYTIQNTGDAALTEPFTVVDSRLGTLPSCGSTPLAPGASTTCTASYTTVESDVGDWIPTTVFAEYGALASAPADTYIAYDDPAQLILVVEANPLVYRQVGDQITYTYTVVNVGEVPLTGPFSVNHFHQDIGLINACGDATTLAVGEKTSCSRVYAIRSQDLDQSPLSTEATANAAGSGVGTLGFTGVRVDKEEKALGFRIGMSPLSFSSAGEVISYIYTISNEGNVPLPGPFTVKIDGLDPITPCGNGPLAVGAHTSCTSGYVVTQSDVEGGSLPPYLGTAQTDGATSANFGVTVPGATGDLLLHTTVTPALYSRLRQEIVYRYTLTNTSGITLTGPFKVMDDQVGTIFCGNLDLPPSVSVTCRGVRTIDQADLSRGVVTSNAIAQGNSTTSQNVRSTINVGSRTLLLTRNANPQGYRAVGDVLTFTYTIRNNSNVTLIGPFSVIDDQVGTLPACGADTLTPGASTECTAPRTITQADLEAGSFTSNAFVTGDGATSPTVSLTVTAQGSANQAPTATDDQAATKPGIAVTINVTGNDSDPDGDTLTVTILTPPANGTATVSNGQIVYTPKAGFSGTDSFTYRVSDGKGGNATATVTVTVSSSSNVEQRIYLPLVNR